MRGLNLEIKDAQRQIKPVHDSYKNSLDNILNGNIDNIVASRINKNPCLLKQITLNT